MKILLTGCAGFIGARTCQLLLQDGHEVVGIDNFNHYYSPILKYHRLDAFKQHERFQFMEGDIEDRGFVKRLFESHVLDAVINLAAWAGVRASIEMPYHYYETNVVGTLNLLENMRYQGVKKFVLASSSSIYAGCPSPFREDYATDRLISPYADSKKSAENLTYTYHHLHGMDATVLRYFTVFGPAGRPDMSPFRFAHWIAQGQPITLFGDGSQTRDFTYIDDIARGTILALKPLGYELINLGGGREPVSIRRLIETLEEKLGQQALIDEQPFQAVDMKDTSADISKAKKLLGWEPLTDFDTGVGKLIDWYRENESWLGEL